MDTSNPRGVTYLKGIGIEYLMVRYRVDDSGPPVFSLVERNYGIFGGGRSVKTTQYDKGSNQGSRAISELRRIFGGASKRAGTSRRTLAAARGREPIARVSVHTRIAFVKCTA
ncbi:hypothetical protein EVAR_20599_1 [Eumeta japonica]|uniref:Uncharacterized protein n=1 Tax=Eumeta variegata TaxID=151549 RepID=A0A4C1UTB7_EUMVA|nr:hypothetical protein EVAR_20599_1 [Eumeta japonica]